jgi:hypothetical protein
VRQPPAGAGLPACTKLFAYGGVIADAVRGVNGFEHPHRVNGHQVNYVYAESLYRIEAFCNAFQIAVFAESADVYLVNRYIAPVGHIFKGLAVLFWLREITSWASTMVLCCVQSAAINKDNISKFLFINIWTFGRNCCVEGFSFKTGNNWLCDQIPQYKTTVRGGKNQGLARLI